MKQNVRCCWEHFDMFRRCLIEILFGLNGVSFIFHQFLQSLLICPEAKSAKINIIINLKLRIHKFNTGTTISNVLTCIPISFLITEVFCNHVFCVYRILET